MNRKQVDSIWLGVSIFFFFMLAVSFLLMPLESETPTESLSIYTLVAGLMFWISIMMGIVTQCVLAHRRKSWHTIHRIKKARLSQRVGIISFFQNTYAAVADVFTILSILGLIIAMIVTQGMGYVCYILVCLFVFSFSMHCILNGKIFYYIINQDKILKTIEKERINSVKKERKERNG